ncbi:Uroporphyrinogen III decarboxylase [hydrothermal vent metagenome]|uniref:uroporphyrinogen decarboxylase n=1 Tax=hydrothermal vent metagenome TaxID=652676 RepID=A0A3B0TZL7_9ZZZZ
MDRSLRFVDVVKGQRRWPPPVWLMRQAGRYLPEYRKLRSGAGSFLDLCYQPKLAAEVTIQPVRRFGMDAAILFADILLVAEALGQGLRFDEGVGPILEPKIDAHSLSQLDLAGAEDRLKPIYETVSLVRSGVNPETAVIGFCGAPWTVATYMAAGGPPGEHIEAKLWAYGDPRSFADLIDMIIELSIDYLVGQIDAGADAVKIFDSWAGVLSEDQFDLWVVAPTKKLIAGVKSRRPNTPVIGFPRGAGVLYDRYIDRTGIDAVALDTTIPMSFGRALQKKCPVQGNIDPMALRAGGKVLDRAVDTVLENLGSGPLVVNLGHGVNKHTNPEHVGQLVRRVHQAKDPG